MDDTTPLLQAEHRSPAMELVVFDIQEMYQMQVEKLDLSNQKLTIETIENDIQSKLVAAFLIKQTITLLEQDLTALEKELAYFARHFPDSWPILKFGSPRDIFLYQGVQEKINAKNKEIEGAEHEIAALAKIVSNLEVQVKALKKKLTKAETRWLGRWGVGYEKKKTICCVM